MTAQHRSATPDRNRQLAAIHAMAKELALTEDSYRARVSAASGGRTGSAGELSDTERADLIKTLKGLGAGKKGRYRETPQVKLIRALWLELADLGAVQERSEAAIAAFVRRQTGQDFGRLSAAAAGQVIEALKSWRQRLAVPKAARHD